MSRVPTCGLCLTAGLVLILAHGGVAMVVYPTESQEPLHNPHMGWGLVEYTHTPDLGRSWPAAEGPVPYPWYDHVQVLFTWAGIERRPGEYDWSAVDRLVDYWAAQGKTVHIIASTEWYFNQDDFIGCPEWVYAMGVPRQGSRTGDGIYPDYNHPVYRERLRLFLAEFARHLCDDPRIGLIAIRAYGAFGEWHSGYQYPTAEERVRALRGVFDIWREAIAGRKLATVSTSYEWMFPTPEGSRGIMPRGTSIYDEQRPSYRDFLERSAFDYVFGFPGICARRDGVGGAVFMEYDGRLLADMFAHWRRPIWCEPFGGYNAYTGPSPVGFPGTGEGDNFLGNAIDEALSHHANYLTMHWGTDFHRKHPELVRYAQRHLGYRFVLARAEVNERLAPGAELVVDQTWENRGVGRCPERYPLAVYLMRGDQVAWWGIDEAFDQRAWEAGQTYEWTTRLRVPADLTPGDYDLRVAMVDETGEPALNLALQGADALKRLSLGTVRVAAESPAAPVPVTGPQPQRTGDAWVLQAPDLLAPESTIMVTFRYQVTRDPAQDLDTDSPGFLRCYATGADDVYLGETRWYDKAGQDPAWRTVLLPLRERDDYRLVWECVGGGEMTVDSVRLQVPPEAAVQRIGYGPDWVRSVREGLQFLGNATPFDRRRPPCPLPVVVASRDQNQVTLPDDNYDFLATRPDTVHLQPNTTYTVWFALAARPQIWQGDYAYLTVRSEALGPASDVGRFMLVQRHTAGPVRRAYTFRTGPAEDYRLVWGLHNGGCAEVSDIVVVRR